MAKPPMEAPGRGENAGVYPNQHKPRWIAHNQNCMPARLKPDTMVNVAFRDGVIGYNDPADAWCWTKFDEPNINIIAYQIAEETK